MCIRCVGSAAPAVPPTRYVDTVAILGDPQKGEKPCTKTGLQNQTTRKLVKAAIKFYLFKFSYKFNDTDESKSTLLHVSVH